MFCEKCQIEVEPMLDQWNNKRCPNCRQMFTTPSSPADESRDKDSSSKAQNQKSVSPGYTDFLKATDKFRKRKHAPKTKT